MDPNEARKSLASCDATRDHPLVTVASALRRVGVYRLTKMTLPANPNYRRSVEADLGGTSGELVFSHCDGLHQDHLWIFSR